jgi:hypothetical protein
MNKIFKNAKLLWFLVLTICKETQCPVMPCYDDITQEEIDKYDFQIQDDYLKILLITGVSILLGATVGVITTTNRIALATLTTYIVSTALLFRQWPMTRAQVTDPVTGKTFYHYSSFMMPRSIFHSLMKQVKEANTIADANQAEMIL